MNTNAEKLRRKIDNLRDLLEQEVSSSTMDFINELVELEIQLQQINNQ